MELSKICKLENQIYIKSNLDKDKFMLTSTIQILFPAEMILSPLAVSMSKLLNKLSWHSKITTVKSAAINKQC